MPGPTAVRDEDLGPEFDRFCDGELADPYGFTARLREIDPVHRSERLNAWILTRYNDVLAGLSGAPFSNDRIGAYVAALTPANRRTYAPLAEHVSGWLGFTDPPKHTYLRSLVREYFTPRLPLQLRPYIEDFVTSVLAHRSNQRLDVVSDLAMPLPFAVICELLGIPPDRRPRLKACADAIQPFTATIGPALNTVAAPGLAALDELRPFFHELLQLRRADPRDDLISRLAVSLDQERLTESEVISLCVFTFVAGFETTTSLIGSGFLLLLRDREQRRRLIANRALGPSAVEEFLRFESPIQMLPRVLREDLRIDGRRMLAGDTVLLMVGAANRDPAQFDDPERLDIGRSPNRHLAFGWATHFCLGAPLARLEAESAIGAFFERYPDATLVEEPEWTLNMTVRCPTRLLVDTRPGQIHGGEGIVVAARHDFSSLHQGLLSPGYLQDPYPMYRQLRETDPVHWFAPWGAWILTRYDDVQGVLRSEGKNFSVVGRIRRAVSALPPEHQQEFSPIVNHFSVGLLHSDPPDHTRLRGLISAAFTPRSIAASREWIVATVDELLDRLRGKQRFDILGDFAFPLPALVVARVLGMPPEDSLAGKRWADAVSHFFGSNRLTLDLARYGQANLLEARTYLSNLADGRRFDPREDVVSRLVAARTRGDPLSQDELLSTAMTFLVGGHETTTALITSALLSLVRFPEQLERLEANPELMPVAIEEFLRFESPNQRIIRIALQDVPVGDRVVRKGESVMCLLGAANRDPEQFPDPDHLDVGRTDNRHLAFALGAHFCIGAPLARLEGQIAMEAILRRFPIYAVDAEPDWIGSPTLRLLRSLWLRVPDTGQSQT
jgi:cytochrome P450